jgi:hypothetical protein
MSLDEVAKTADTDCWDVFGSDEEPDEDDSPSASSIDLLIAAHLAQAFLKADSLIRLSERVVGLEVGSESNGLIAALEQRGMTVVCDLLPGTLPMDAVVVLKPIDKAPSFHSMLLPRGILITNQINLGDDQHFFKSSPLQSSAESFLVEFVRRPIHVHTSKCTWLPPSHSEHKELELLLSATISLSSHERKTGRLTENSIENAVACLKESGYCIILGLLDPIKCSEWGRTVLETVHAAAKVLLERDQVDIYNPLNSKAEPQAYKELSMREDLRLDIRHGPELTKLRSREDKGNESIVVSAETKHFNGFLRGDLNLLEIIRRTMNPKEEALFRGNLGRFNFGGNGPNGSFQDLRLSPVGGIVTFSGCGDQAIHADTPHLFEHIPDLPAHYINVFAPGTRWSDKVGATAFFHGSHNLEFTAKYCGSAEGYHKIYPHLVRPTLDLGDVVLFDCRILHFGMSNSADSATERVLLYTNTTQAWFQDPKNWDDRRPIFT